MLIMSEGKKRKIVKTKLKPSPQRNMQSEQYTGPQTQETFFASDSVINPHFKV